MYYNFKKFILSFILFLSFTFIISTSLCIKSFAMDVTHYSRDDIISVLPEKYHADEYLYGVNDQYHICFATYNNKNYQTSIKKEADVNRLLYCVNNNNTISFHKNYALKNDLFNNQLRTRIGIALYYGPQKWNELADSKFTTGNFITDYYMTQIVIHSLINKYGGSKSEYGIDFNEIEFKENTGTLAKKTKEFYEYCCNAKVTSKDGNFESVDFSFQKPSNQLMYLQNDYLVSPTIECNSNTDNATVSSYKRTIAYDTNSIDTGFIIEEKQKKYDSPFYVKAALSDIDKLSPALYKVKILEDIDFNCKIAGFWKCSEKGYEDTNQEVTGLITETAQVSDQMSFDLLIGQLVLHKKDSITKENIPDAEFEILQYNAKIQDYEFYKKMTYNSTRQQYESGNLYLSENNKEGKFKVIEKTPGQNYVLDWDGQFFQITTENFLHEIEVENQPILGKLQIEKTGECWTFLNNEFNNDKKIILPNVTFTLYAKENISVANKILYNKNQKIADLITDENGIATVNNLPIGEYYICETKTNDNYVLDSKIYSFSITRDSSRKYSEVKYTFNNELKTCDIEIYKIYYEKNDVDQKNKIPLKGAKFGLYAKNDICDLNGNTIISKDSCIKEAYSDKDGKIIFSNLPYADYYIKELEAPEDFVINDGIIAISKADFTYNEQTQSYVCKKDIINTKQQFNISIKKTADAFVNYKEEVSEYGTYFSYEIGAQELEQVTFSLYDMNKKLIAQQTTDANGNAEFKALEPGKYYLVESSAPAEYKLIETGKYITCKMENTEYNVTSPPIMEEKVHNELCDSTISLMKYGENAIVENNKLKYNQIPLSKVVFGIYQNFDYTFPDNGQILSKGSCVGYIVTDQNGKGSYTNKLPCGDYYLKELSTNPDFDLDMEEHHFKIQPNNNKNISIRYEDETAFYNKLSKASVKIIKTDANTEKKLKNVEFTLYNENSEKIGVYKTNKKGEIIVENLPYGKYYFLETKAKKGYYSTNNKYHFVINTNEQVTLNITNSPILKLGFDENYKFWLSGIGITFIAFLLLAITDYKILKHDKK